MNKHGHGTTSNTDECFRTFIGCKVRGILHDRNSEGGYMKILVFDCGWGLVINENGAHWTESPPKILTIINHSKRSLEETTKELEHILKLAGE